MTPDPRFEDGSADVVQPSTRTSQSVVHQLLASLTSACLALEELDFGVIRGLRDNAQYVARMSRLMVPLFAVPATEGEVEEEETGGDLIVVSSRSPVHPRDFQIVASASNTGSSHLKQSKEETSSRLSSYFAPTTGPRPLSAALTLIQPKNPFLATGVSTHPQPSTKEVIKRLGPGDLVPEMTLAEQYHIVAALLRKKDLRTGEVWYLVDKGWWNSWLKASGNSNDLHLKVAGIRYTMEAIDNSQLVDPSTYDLRQGLVARVSKLEEVRGPAQGDIFVAVPREVWEDCLVRWYGKPLHTITRALKWNGHQGFSVDLYPRGQYPPIEDKEWAIGLRWALINRLIVAEEPLHGTVYVVSSKWWFLWRLQEDGMPGLDLKTCPIDNSDLLGERKKLKKGLSRKAYVHVPKEAWYLLKTWFGVRTEEDTISVELPAPSARRVFFPF